MIRTFATLIGLLLLVAGLALLFGAWGPNSSKEVLELGGALVSQQSLSERSQGTTFDAANLPDLPVVVDGAELSTNTIGAQPGFSSAALEDVSVMEQAESDAVVGLQVDAADEVVNEQVSVELVPLELSTASTGTDDLSGQGGAGGVVNLVQRVVEFEYPQSFRLGRSENVRLTLKPVGSGQIAVVPEIEDNTLIATPILLTDYHDTHNAFFSARLVAPDVQSVALLTAESQQAARGEDATWRWSVKVPENAGRFTMTLILDLRWDPKPGTSGTVINRGTIWSQSVEAEVEYVFGIVSVPQASLLGTILAIIGFVAQVPTMATFFGYMLSRLSGRPQRRTTKRRSTTKRR